MGSERPKTASGARPRQSLGVLIPFHWMECSTLLIASLGQRGATVDPPNGIGMKVGGGPPECAHYYFEFSLDEMLLQPMETNKDVEFDS